MRQPRQPRYVDLRSRQAFLKRRAIDALDANARPPAGSVSQRSELITGERPGWRNANELQLAFSYA